MDLLHKRSLRVGQPVRPEHTVDLRNYALRIHHMLEYRLDNYGIEASISERELVRVAYDGRPRSPVDIGPDELEVGPFDKSPCHCRWYPRQSQAHVPAGHVPLPDHRGNRTAVETDRTCRRWHKTTSWPPKPAAMTERTLDGRQYVWVEEIRFRIEQNRYAAYDAPQVRPSCHRLPREAASRGQRRSARSSDIKAGLSHQI